ncbi:universal stress protein UspA-like protein [Halogeometricum pallidum JCM 14848]|uniref:Universal stress protein UspA-like protein n=1 Tax=Halogeometricum pallidum JCM 14848 TaxID=1227487 RepID=M0D9S9_HALPD|nr:universal stress protein [Halogeometricum pallidum]ELZ31472.1 universal stress protein UspA-like protein [Halogeometricum pallidum JCM 14848]
MYDSILVPTDGSEHAGRAAEHAGYLAGLFDATVHLLSVADVQAAAGAFGAGGVDETYISRLEAEGERAVEAAADAVEGADAVQTAVVRGRPDEAILDYAGENGIDLVVMGTHGRTGLTRYVAGSVSERVLRLSDVPVLTVRAVDGRGTDGYEEVLVPTDGSEYAELAVGHGLAVAEATGARVHAVNVVDLGSMTMGAPYTFPDDVIARIEADGETATEEVASRARERGLEAVTDVRRGSAARTLLDYVDREDIDLVAMGTAGRTGLDRYLLGSTTEELVRRSDAPVLAVNARGRTSE